MFDLILHPDHLHNSATYGLLIGYAMTITACIVQYPAYITFVGLRDIKHSKILQILVQDGFSFIANGSAVLAWRGLWHVFTLYFIPHIKIGRLWLGHTCGLLGLMLILSGNTVLVRLCDIDGQSEDGVTLQLDYIRYLIQWRDKYIYKPSKATTVMVSKGSFK